MARGEGAPHPDRHRRRGVSAPLARERRRCAPAIRASRVRVRRRLVPEGRRRLGRGARAEADQGPGRAALGRRAATRPGSRAVLPPDRAVARLRAGGARATRDPAIGTRCWTTSTRSRRHTRRSTSAWSRRVTRAGRARCSNRWRRASRSSRRESGRPPISSQHGVNGWMVDVEDVEALAGSVVHVAGASPDELSADARRGPGDCRRELVPGAASSLARAPRRIRRHGRRGVSRWI